MSELTDEQLEKVFEACAEIALCYPPRTLDPLAVYKSFWFTDKSNEMEARFYRIWMKRSNEFPWALDRARVEAHIAWLLGLNRRAFAKAHFKGKD